MHVQNHMPVDGRGVMSGWDILGLEKLHITQAPTSRTDGRVGAS